MPNVLDASTTRFGWDGAVATTTYVVGRDEHHHANGDEDYSNHEEGDDDRDGGENGLACLQSLLFEGRI